MLLMLMMVMAMMVMVTMLQGHVRGHHLAGGPGHGAVVEGVVRHAVLGPACGLAEKGENICDQRYLFHVCIRRIMLDGYPMLCVQSFN